MESLCNTIANFFCKKNYIPYSKIDLYQYSLQIFLQFTITYFFIIITGIILKMFIECLLLFLSFSLLRKFCGGIHLKSFYLCFIISIIINLTGLYLIANKWFLPEKYFPIFFSVFFLAIIILNPVSHPNKKTSEKETKFFKLFSSIIAFMIYILFLILQNKYSNYAYSIATGEIIVSIMMILGKIMYRKTNKIPMTCDDNIILTIKQ